MPVSTQPPDSKFAYVVLVARRARQLMAGGRPLVENPKNHKYTRVAEEEMRKGLLEFDVPEAFDNAEEDGKRRRS